MLQVLITDACTVGCSASTLGHEYCILEVLAIYGHPKHPSATQQPYYFARPIHPTLPCIYNKKVGAQHSVDVRGHLSH
jgi:hypothetical protein